MTWIVILPAYFIIGFIAFKISNLVLGVPEPHSTLDYFNRYLVFGLFWPISVWLVLCYNIVIFFMKVYPRGSKFDRLARRALSIKERE